MTDFNDSAPSQSMAPDAPPADQRQWAMFAHFSALAGLVTGGLGCIIGPLIIWLVKKDTMPFVNDQGREALNFNITIGIAVIALTILGVILAIVLIGFLFFFLAFAVSVYWLVMTIIAGIKANEGVAYRYPFTLRLVK